MLHSLPTIPTLLRIVCLAAACPLVHTGDGAWLHGDYVWAAINNPTLLYSTGSYISVCWIIQSIISHFTHHLLQASTPLQRASCKNTQSPSTQGQVDVNHTTTVDEKQKGDRLSTKQLKPDELQNMKPSPYALLFEVACAPPDPMLIAWYGKLCLPSA